MNKDQQMMDEKELKKNDGQDSDNDTVDDQIQTELSTEPIDPVAKLEENLALEKDKYLRLVAEFENYKKRTIRDRIEFLKSAGSDVIISILPVLDDFERAGQADPLPEGILHVYNKLFSVLSQKGLKPMEAKGKDFDPDLHDAIAGVPVEDESMKNKVVNEIEKGYFLNDKVIRHAKVIVGN